MPADHQASVAPTEAWRAFLRTASLVALSLAGCATTRLWEEGPARPQPDRLLACGFVGNGVDALILYDDDEVYRLRTTFERPMGLFFSEDIAGGDASSIERPIRVVDRAEGATWGATLAGGSVTVRDAGIPSETLHIPIPRRSISWSRPRTMLTMLATPLTVAFDLVTSPIQVAVLLAGGHFE